MGETLDIKWPLKPHISFIDRYYYDFYGLEEIQRYNRNLPFPDLSDEELTVKFREHERRTGIYQLEDEDLTMRDVIRAIEAEEFEIPSDIKNARTNEYASV
jgi:hypothetical protein